MRDHRRCTPPDDSEHVAHEVLVDCHVVSGLTVRNPPPSLEDHLPIEITSKIDSGILLIAGDAARHRQRAHVGADSKLDRVNAAAIILYSRGFPSRAPPATGGWIMPAARAGAAGAGSVTPEAGSRPARRHSSGLQNVGFHAGATKQFAHP